MKITEEKREKKKFNIFNMNKDGKGVYEVESRKPTLGFFFKLYFRKFTHLLQLNLLMLVMVIPLIAILFIYLMGDKTPTVTDPVYTPLIGIATSSPTPKLFNTLDLSSIQMEVPVFSQTSIIVIIALLVFMAITWGWQSVGSAYVLRGLFRGDPVFVFSDYFYGIKRNFKQAFFLGLIDFVITAVLIVDFSYFSNMTGSFAMDFMYYATIAMLIIWIMMRFYIYNLLVTFELKNFKIIKNSFIFSMLGIKRNFMALLGIVLLIVLHVMLIFVLLPIGISIPLVLPFVYIISTFGFMATYAAFPVIQKYMIDPYADAISEENNEIE